MIGFVFVSEFEAKSFLKKVVAGKDSKGCTSILIGASFIVVHFHIS